MRVSGSRRRYLFFAYFSLYNLRLQDTKARRAHMIVIDRLEHMEQRYNELQAQFSLPEVINDHEKYQKTAKLLREIETPVEKYRELKQVQQGLAEARAMLAATDAELRAMAEEEIATLAPREAELQ